MKYECKSIQILLPNYAEGLCCEEERRAVEEHVRGCEECRELLDALFAKEYELEDSPPKKEKPSPKRRRRRFLALLSAVVLLFAAVGVAFVYNPDLYYQYLYWGDRVAIRLHLDNVDPSFPIEGYIQIHHLYAGTDEGALQETMNELYALSLFSSGLSLPGGWTSLSWERTDQGNTWSASIPAGQKGTYLVDLCIRNELYPKLFPGRDFSGFAVGDTYPIFCLESLDVWNLKYDLAILNEEQGSPVHMEHSFSCPTHPELSSGSSNL